MDTDAYIVVIIAVSFLALVLSPLLVTFVFLKIAGPVRGGHVYAKIVSVVLYLAILIPWFRRVMHSEASTIGVFIGIMSTIMACIIALKLSDIGARVARADVRRGNEDGQGQAVKDKSMR